MRRRDCERDEDRRPPDQVYHFHIISGVAYFIAMPLTLRRTVAACSTFLLFSSCTKATMERLLALISYFFSLKVNCSSRSLLRDASKSSVFFFKSALTAARSKLALTGSAFAGSRVKPLPEGPPIARTTIGWRRIPFSPVYRSISSTRSTCNL